MKRGYQQREANYKGSAKEEEVGRVLSGFSLSLRPRKKFKLFFYQSSFNTSFSLQVISCPFVWKFIQSWCYGKRSYLTYFVLPGKFSNDVERRAQVSTFLSLQLIVAGFTLFIWKICTLPKMCCFTQRTT